MRRLPRVGKVGSTEARDNREETAMDQTLGTMVDTAADHTRDIVQHAGELTNITLGTVADVTGKMSRRARRRADKMQARSQSKGRSVKLRVLVLAALGIAIVVAVRRQQLQQVKRYEPASPAPDAFGAAVQAEHQIMGDGASRATATPGA
jgi:hypothetical protein